MALSDYPDAINLVQTDTLGIDTIGFNQEMLTLVHMKKSKYIFYIKLII